MTDFSNRTNLQLKKQKKNFTEPKTKYEGQTVIFFLSFLL